MDNFPPELRVMRIYWTNGSTLSNPRCSIPNEVKSPNVSGYGNALVYGAADANKFLVLDPYYLQAYTISKKSHEMHFAEDVTDKHAPGDIAELLLKTWAMTVRHGFGASYSEASVFLRKLGAKVPTYTTNAAAASVNGTDDKEGPSSRRVSRPAAMSLKKPVPRNCGKGRILEWLLANPGGSVLAMQADLDMKKAVVNAQLFILHDVHGIGQNYKGDAVTVVLPPNCENPFKD